MKLKLKALNMKLANEHEHPQVDCRKQYLILYHGNFYAGRFSRQWYGLNFEGVYPAGLQFDEPGTNASNWKQIWEIVKS